MKSKTLPLSFGLCIALVSGPFSLRAAPEATVNDGRPILKIERKKGIDVVFQITAGSTEAHKGLTALREVYKNYREEGVPAEEMRLHAVIHGDAADHLLTDAAWNRVKQSTTGNPSASLVAELLKSGVRLELCNSRRVINGWEKSDILPGVALVANAFHRIAELQLEGAAYIRQ